MMILDGKAAANANFAGGSLEVCITTYLQIKHTVKARNTHHLAMSVANYKF